MHLHPNELPCSCPGAAAFPRDLACIFHEPGPGQKAALNPEVGTAGYRAPSPAESQPCHARPSGTHTRGGQQTQKVSGSRLLSSSAGRGACGAIATETWTHAPSSVSLVSGKAAEKSARIHFGHCFFSTVSHCSYNQINKINWPHWCQNLHVLHFFSKKFDCSLKMGDRRKALPCAMPCMKSHKCLVLVQIVS